MRRAGMCLLIALLLLASACGGARSDDGEREGSDVAETNVTFATSDDETLTGRLFGRGRVGVTLGHMYSADATSWYEAAREIARAGYMTLAFNFRGYAGSTGEKSPRDAPLDIEGAAALLKERGARDVAFVGASMGGTASIISAQDQEPLAVVALSAPTNFMGLDAPLAATTVQRPVLLMASRGDIEAFEALDALERALPNPDTKVYDGDAHGTHLLEDNPDAIDEIVAFLERYAPLTSAIPTQEER